MIDRVAAHGRIGADEVLRRAADGVGLAREVQAVELLPELEPMLGICIENRHLDAVKTDLFDEFEGRK